MAWARYSHASIDSRNPRALGACDRCGFIYNHNMLAWQHDWRGPRLQNLRVLVCPTCMDEPQQNGQRTILIPPDPIPIMNPRTDSNMINGAGPQYGPELVYNGGFTSDDGWSLLDGALIQDGLLVIIFDDTGTGTASTTATETITSGAYKVSFDFVYSGISEQDTVRVAVGGTFSDDITVNPGYSTTYTTQVTSAASNQLILIRCSPFDRVAIDNLSVVRVL